MKHEVVLLSSPHCGPCRAFKPVFEGVAAELKDVAEFVQRDVTKRPDLSASLGVRTVPTTLILRDGEVLHRHTGYMNRAQFKHFLSPLIGAN